MLCIIRQQRREDKCHSACSCLQTLPTPCGIVVRRGLPGRGRSGTSLSSMYDDDKYYKYKNNRNNKFCVLLLSFLFIFMRKRSHIRGIHICGCPSRGGAVAAPGVRASASKERKARVGQVQGQARGKGEGLREAAAPGTGGRAGGWPQASACASHRSWQLGGARRLGRPLGPGGRRRVRRAVAAGQP
jgi:hypothetical protein